MPNKRLLWVAVATPLLVAIAQFAAVRPTNFASHDEWLVLSLAERGLMSFPYADRPLCLVWSLPAGWLTPRDVLGHEIVEVVYLGLAGGLVSWLGLARLGLPAPLALAAGVFAATWAPLDAARLQTVQVGARYAGCAAAAMAAIALFAEGFFRERKALAAAALVPAAVAALSIEGALPLLAGAPLVVVAADPRTLRDARSRRRLLGWSAAWWAVLAITMVPLLLSLAGLRGGYRYQSAIGLDPHPLRLAASLLRQLGFSLGPLATSPLAELARLPVAAAAGALLLGLAALGRGALLPLAPARGAALRAVGLGLALAVLGWIALVLSPLVRTPARNQILSAPGVGLLLAGGIGAFASLVPRRAGTAVAGLAAAWVVAVGTGRVAALQDGWDGRSFWPRQRAALAQLVAQAPALAPGTVVVLFDETRSWPVNFGFTHAIHYLYGESVAGVVWQGHEFLYSSRFEPGAVVREPWPVIREAWRSPPTRHRSDEVVAVRYAGGRLSVLEHWPPELPPLPAAATYAPRSRILPGPPPASARILERER